MVQSNILSLFTRPTRSQVTEQEGQSNSDDIGESLQQDCIPCMTVQLIMSIGLGTYLQSDSLFKENGIVDYKKHPIIWQRSLRGFGLGLIGFGLYRGYSIVRGGGV